MLEIDLHTYTVDEAIAVFMNTYDREVRRGSNEPIKVIHGWGASGTGGAIKKRLRSYLDSVPGCLTWNPGEDVDNNPGSTIVYPKTVLPAINSTLADAIVAYCSSPRTESKIIGEFRRHGQPAVRAAIRDLLRSGRLTEFRKGSRKVYSW